MGKGRPWGSQHPQAGAIAGKCPQSSGGQARSCRARQGTSLARAAKGRVGSRSPSKSWCQLTFPGEKMAKCSLPWSRLEFAQIFNKGSHFKLLGTKPRWGTLGLLTLLLLEVMSLTSTVLLKHPNFIGNFRHVSLILHSSYPSFSSKFTEKLFDLFFSIFLRKKKKGIQAVHLPNCFTALKCYFCLHSHRSWLMCFFFWSFNAD